ncbi:MAG: hypothetical protein ACLT1W_14895 [Alistipes onderdonkii]
MKRLLLLTVAVLVMAYSVRAQEAKFDEPPSSEIDKLKADTENPKKSGKASTWIELGKAYYDATIATNGLFAASFYGGNASPSPKKARKPSPVPSTKNGPICSIST